VLIAINIERFGQFPIGGRTFYNGIPKMINPHIVLPEIRRQAVQLSNVIK